MFTVSVRWAVGDGKALYKTFESHEATSKEAIKDITDQLFASLSYTPDTVSFKFEAEPSLAYQKLRGCTCKKNYIDEHQAIPDADMMNRHRKPGLPKEAPYKCVFCKFWHIGASKWKPVQ